MAIDKQEIEKLKASLSPSSDVLTPDSEGYAESIKRWSSASEKPAGLVVLPATAEDVSKAILFSKANKHEIAVMGGGHGTSGACSTDGGVSINLSKMRHVSVDPKAKTITAEGGCLWVDVDNAAEKHGLAAVGGTVNHTGIGGLTLGGGYGYLTAAHGMVVDNLLSVQFVLADGSIVTASATENPDLFWASKGAGIGFGVATSFVYQAHEQKAPVWGGMLVFQKTQLHEVLAFGSELLTHTEGKVFMITAFGSPPPALQPAIMAVVFYNGTEAEGRAYFEPILKLGPLVDMTTVLPFPKMNEMLNGPMFHGARRTMKGSAFLGPLNIKFAEEIFDDYEAFITQVPDAVMTVVAWEFMPYNKILEVPQTATAFANRGAYGNLLFGPGWTDPENDGACREWTRVMSKKARAELEKAKAKGTDAETQQSVGEYGNYDSLGEGGKVVFGVNFPRLVELKKRYDPENVFSKGPSLVA
ncbi:FAD-binding domain-containing protein [Stipitochalara longipes BDJ]|nr:FAD-binding domain-containing protein [Stipitochalara longipes BDJ]